MTEGGIHEAKTHLSKLLRRVAAGERIITAKAGKPVARLLLINKRKSRKLGQDQGLFKVPDDFDSPLPEKILWQFKS